MIAKAKVVRDSKHYAGVANIRWKKERERQAHVLAKKIATVMNKCVKGMLTEEIALNVAKALVAKKIK